MISKNCPQVSFSCSNYNETMWYPFPPNVVVTWSGSWLTAAFFFAQNFNNFCSVVSALPSDSAHMEKPKLLMKKKKSQCRFSFHKFTSRISSTWNHAAGGTPTFVIHDKIAVIDDVRNNLREVPGMRGSSLNKKSDKVFSKNEGFLKLHDLN